MINWKTQIRFLDKIKRAENSDCWIWTAGKHRNGYGNFSYKRKTQFAHRISYQIFKGSIPNGLHVLHKCDVRACVNPNHLFLGTHADNMADMINKGHLKIPDNSGIRNGSNKLTEIEVYEIINLKGKLPLQQIAKQFYVSTSLISQIQNRKCWLSLPAI